MIPPNVQAHIDGLLEEAAEYQRLAEQCRAAASLLRGQFRGTSFPRDRNDRPPTTYAEQVEIALKESGRPMKVNGLVDVLLSRGFGSHLPRNYIYNNTYSAMVRMPTKFVRYDKSWGLAEWGPEAAEAHEEPGADEKPPET